jgi:tetraacyldisaccharide 4'-kinase
LNLIERSWDGWHPLTVLLLPLTGIFCLLAWLRRLAYRWGWIRSKGLAVPVVIVGNISVGGTGKSPLIIWMAQRLIEMGHRPGIILRGYGGSVGSEPTQVTPESAAGEVGDEAVMIRRRAQCPVYVGSQRVETGRRLLAEQDCDLILSDDGLQHYALERDLEIVVIDGKRRFGNGLCLPAGPLREPTGRLQEADLVLVNGDSQPGELSMRVSAEQAVSLSEGISRPLAEFAAEPLHAVAGIGHPERFFSTLRDAGLQPECHPFPDHHPYTQDDFRAISNQTVLMTEKDGVKCEQFASPGFWYVPASAHPDEAFQQAFESMINRLTNG